MEAVMKGPAKVWGFIQLIACEELSTPGFVQLMKHYYNTLYKSHFFVDLTLMQILIAVSPKPEKTFQIMFDELPDPTVSQNNRERSFFERAYLLLRLPMAEGLFMKLFLKPKTQIEFAYLEEIKEDVKSHLIPFLKKSVVHALSIHKGLSNI